MQGPFTDFPSRALLCTAIVLVLALAVASTPALAQETAAADTAKRAEAQLDTVSIIGSRRVQRASDTTTPVPVDVLPMQHQVETGGQFDLAQSLQATAPSFISTRQTGADGADLVDGAALRGLGSDQTLVLVNGKRHHTVSLVNIYGARNRGNTGTDLNAVPVMAIDRIEILRDGAAAQYGSDAIAGVMNLVLKRRPGCEAALGWGQYSRGDGENWLASAYCGMKLVTGGSLAITGEWQDRGRSNRSTVENPLRIIGDSQVLNRTLYVNGDQPLGEAATLYFTAGMQSRAASSAAFARGGVGSDDIPSRNSAAMYPDGFVPFIDGDLQDRFGILGVRGDAGLWHWDLSQTHGYNELRYDINHTLNASIANANADAGRAALSPTRFDAGGFSFQQDTTNLDVSRFYDGVLQGMNVAFGAEHRNERYRIRAGEPGSYADYDGVGNGGNAGSQGFPGFQPSDVTNRGRSSDALYADLELDMTQRLTTDFAVRWEDFSDFGSTVNGKVAAAFKATDALLLRGSLSTGFRAPSLQQKYFSSTITDFISGQPVDIVIAPDDSALARAAGLGSLREEKSKSGTLGITWSPSRALSITADAYRIDIKDRIILTGEFGTDDPAIGAILAARDVGVARFFVNAVDTRTTGLDITAAHDSQLWGGALNTFVAANFNRTEVTRVNAPASLVGREDVLLPERDRLFVENGAPRRKAVLGFDWSRGGWSANLKVIHFGPQVLGTFSGTSAGVPNQHYAAKTSADVSGTYAVTPKAKLTFGVVNAFDVFPTRQDINETDNGHIYESVQFGLNGRAYFARFWYGF
ncbi:TonB-dependent receptor plug domain-containing protein [Cognatilysobacter lacus]|uniref:TonB-dependent receptor n=1 Tax=Cognatilysobacter lacus TaxID=1643323 RepID=A0A5D8Z858_9GAMM|nr:TonB-dependent receptor [Lysobacter lacus]TZF90273.1 TonB-dependent receptor [Lysobacter lacus]